MIKQLIIYSAVFALLFFLLLHGHDWILKQNDIGLRFSFYDTDLFFAVSSALICIHLQFFSGIETLKSQLGYIYLPTLFIKGVIFFISFKNSVFSIEKLTTSERLSLLIPLFIFLIAEVYFVIKILKETNAEI
ncbi:hypothetical protein BTO05_08405 [Winogradskyella sp. PC-19]|jgi:hypothetical protein|nr:hypothetical protein BTO05_08405 [Winogradskyella sp. PC-19]